MSKDIQFSFRCESDLRDRFVQTCQSLDRPAGQVLREFMRQFIQDQSQATKKQQQSEVQA